MEPRVVVFLRRAYGAAEWALYFRIWGESQTLVGKRQGLGQTADTWGSIRALSSTYSEAGLGFLLGDSCWLPTEL